MALRFQDFRELERRNPNLSNLFVSALSAVFMPEMKVAFRMIPHMRIF
ncbi:MAG: hypothetical protein NZZ60_07525 [Bacteroidia bacterium]|nr:hypothetical protein [Bacteroidia bacterium]